MSAALSVVIMIVMAAVGFFVGSLIDYQSATGAMCGAILFAMIAGIACIIKVLENSKKEERESQ